MPNLDLDEILDGRDNFTKEEWIDVHFKILWNGTYTI